MSTSLKTAEPRHKAFREDAIALLKKYAGELSAPEMLALGAHLVGQLIAFQDQRTMTPERAMEIVGSNIEQGNLEAQAEVAGKPAGSA